MNVDWKPWAQLVRVPNTFTSCADVLAGMCIAGGLSHSFLAHPYVGLVAALASICMYWAGMILNDVFDLEIDIQQGRPGPLVTGRILPATARRAGIALLVAGIALIYFATLIMASSVAPSDALPLSSFAYWIPACIACLLAIAIVAYDGPMKGTPAAPAIMGICRGLNMALGLGIVSSGLGMSIGTAAIVIILGHVTYITGLTIAARREAGADQSRTRLIAGWSTCFAGAAAIAIGPRFEPDRWQRLEPTYIFPGLIAILLLPLMLRSLHSIVSLEPKKLGMAIKQSIVSILFLDAALALQFAGNWAGILICGLVIPTLALGKAFRAT